MRACLGRLSLSAAALVLSVSAVRAQYVIPPPGTRQPVGTKSPRVPPLAESQWTDAHKAVVAKYARDGRADNGLRTLLNLPELAEGVMPYTTYLVDESSLSPRHRALLIMRAAWLCGNQAIWAGHAGRARAAGLNDADLARIARGPDAGWEPFDATLMKMTDELYVNSSVSNATWTAVMAQYDLFHAMDAVETVNHFVVLSMIYNVFGVQPDAEWKDRLPTDVPYRVAVPTREPALASARVEPGEGRGIAVGRTFSRYAKLNERWSPRQTFILRVSKLSPRHREMLILRMGWNCRSEYEWAKHVGSVGRAREHGLDPGWIAEGPKAQGWSPLERTLLHVADELYHDGNVSDATWKALSGGYDLGLAMSAVFSAADYRAISMSLNTYGVQLEEGDERFPAIPTP